MYGFIGAKGGVGTTTVAVNIATVLGMASKPETCTADRSAPYGATLRRSPASSRAFRSSMRSRTCIVSTSFFGNLVVRLRPIRIYWHLQSDPLRGSSDGIASSSVIAFASCYLQTHRDRLATFGRGSAGMLDAVNTIYVVANQELATVKSAARLSAMLRERYGRDKVTLMSAARIGMRKLGAKTSKRPVGARSRTRSRATTVWRFRRSNKGRPVALDNHNDLSASFKRFAHGLAGYVPPASRKARRTVRPADASAFLIGESGGHLLTHHDSRHHVRQHQTARISAAQRTRAYRAAESPPPGQAREHHPRGCGAGIARAHRRQFWNANSRTTPLSLSERESLIVEVLDELFGLGPLEALLADRAISDILVNQVRPGLHRARRPARRNRHRVQRRSSPASDHRADRQRGRPAHRRIESDGRCATEGRLARQRDHPAAGAQRSRALDSPIPDGPARCERPGERESLTAPMLEFLRSRSRAG